MTIIIKHYGKEIIVPDGYIAVAGNPYIAPDPKAQGSIKCETIIFFYCYSPCIIGHCPFASGVHQVNEFHI